MFATNWLLTLFTRVIEFSMIYELWEIFLFERDKYFIFFFAVALITSHRKLILSMGSFDQITPYLMTIKIPDFKGLSITYYEAVKIRANTPISF